MPKVRLKCFLKSIEFEVSDDLLEQMIARLDAKAPLDADWPLCVDATKRVPILPIEGASARCSVCRLGSALHAAHIEGTPADREAHLCRVVPIVMLVSRIIEKVPAEKRTVRARRELRYFRRLLVEARSHSVSVRQVVQLPLFREPAQS